MKQVFEGFIYTEENGTMIKKVMDSNFKDWEDGLQYFLCEFEKIDLIITNNLHDFFPATIPVMNAFDFVQRYYDV